MAGHGTSTAFHGGCRCEACKEAGRAYTRAWRAAHPGAASEHSRKYRKENQDARRAYDKWLGALLQSETRETATRHRQLWTGAELEIALRPELTTKEAARLLGRTYAAVNTIRVRASKDPRKTGEGWAS